MYRRVCISCGKDISDRPKGHYLCYSCWKKQFYGTRRYKLNRF